MRALQRNNIVDVFVWVDDSLPKQVKPGAPSVLSDSELLTMFIWDGLTEPHKTLRSLYGWIAREYTDCFPKLPTYQNFVAHSTGCCRHSVGCYSRRCRQQHRCVLRTVPCCQFAGLFELTGIRL